MQDDQVIMYRTLYPVNTMPKQPLLEGKSPSSHHKSSNGASTFQQQTASCFLNKLNVGN